MENQKLIKFMFIGLLLFGGAFELLSSHSPNLAGNNRITARQMRELDVKAFSVGQTNRATTKLRNKKLKPAVSYKAAQFNRRRIVLNDPSDGTVEHNSNKGKKVAKAKTKKKKKKKKASKKKKKSAEELEKELAQKQLEADRLREAMEDSERARENENIDNNDIVISGVPLNARRFQRNAEPNDGNNKNGNGEDDDTDFPKSFEEWSALLLTKANPTEASRLSQLFRERKVSRERFYQITEAMIASEDNQISALGLKTTAEAENMDSFVILSEYLGSSNKPEDNLTYAEELVNTVYTQVKRLPVLKNILELRTKDEEAIASLNGTQLLALKTLKQSAQLNLVVKTEPSRTPSQADSNLDKTPLYVSSYQQMVPITDKLIEESTGQILAQARDTKATLETLLAQWTADNQGPKLSTAGLE